eukprot:141154-Chlamydomonas_euryale.AAC.1
MHRWVTSSEWRYRIALNDRWPATRSPILPPPSAGPGSHLWRMSSEWRYTRPRITSAARRSTAGSVSASWRGRRWMCVARSPTMSSETTNRLGGRMQPPYTRTTLAWHRRAMICSSCCIDSMSSASMCGGPAPPPLVDADGMMTLIATAAPRYKPRYTSPVAPAPSISSRNTEMSVAQSSSNWMEGSSGNAATLPVIRPPPPPVVTCSVSVSTPALRRGLRPGAAAGAPPQVLVGTLSAVARDCGCRCAPPPAAEPPHGRVPARVDGLAC